MKNRTLALACAGMIAVSAAGSSNTTIQKLRIQNADSPIAVEDRHPMISWQMSSDERGQMQTAYRIVVTRENDGSTVWDTGRRESRESMGIPYQGVALQADRGYAVELTVWDREGDAHTLSSRFETGMMSPKESAWKGAKWIGSTRAKLDAQSMSLFDIETDFIITKGGTASLVFGAQDLRLGNAFLNDFGTQSKESYIKTDVDFEKKEIRIFRVGYYKEDKADTPVIIINKENYPQSNLDAVFSARAAGEKHSINIRVEASQISFIIDGIDVITSPRRGGGFAGFAVGNTSGPVRNASNVSINKLGNGGDYPSFPNMASVGFAAAPGQEVTFSGYRLMSVGQSEDRILYGEGRGKNCSELFGSLAGFSVKGDAITVSGGARGTIGWADPSHGGETMLRAAFAAGGKKIKSAKLYATAMGIYEMYINAARVGDAWFAPGDSQYRETMGYHAYDVTGMLREGENVIGARLAGGWYTGFMTFTASNYNFFGDHEALLARLVITYEDGSVQEVVSDPQNWKAYTEGPVRSGSFFQGEVYDASKQAAVKGWNEAGYDDSAWKAAEVIEKRDWVEFDLMARYDEPVRQRETLTATKVMPTHSSDGHTYIYNMGVNMVGVPSVTIPAGWLKNGDKVVFAYGEQLYPGLKGDSKEHVARFGAKGRGVAGHVLFETNRAAQDIDIYIADGDGEVTISPRFTYRGYQYIQITLPSHSGPLPLENIKGLVLSSSEIPTGRYTAKTTDGKTGDLINQLFRNIQRSQLGNFFTIPTDCPQRNERMGWTGDAQAYTRTGIYNADTQNFYRQWMVALRADQGVGDDKEVPGGIGSTVPTYNKTDDPTFATGTTWSAAVCQVPWQMYIQYGDKQIIEENIETMMDWLNGMAFYKLSDEHPYLSSKAAGLADWLAQDSRTPSDIVNNAIYIHMMEVTAIMASAIGREDYAQTLRLRHDLAKKDWNKAYVDPATGKTRGVEGRTVHTQASYATPLNFNCFDETNKPRAEKWLAALAANPTASGPTAEEDEAQKDLPKPFIMNGPGGASTDNKFKPYTITTGFSGTPNILPALSRGGYADEAYKMISCTDFASWLYPVTKGATSVWERWNSYDNAFSDPSSNSMNSFNHFALGAVGQWMFEFQLGITTDHGEGKAGYGDFVLQPSAGGNYTSLEGCYESNYGTICSSWTADGKGTMTSYKATVPANTCATLYLPVSASVASCSGCEGASFEGFETRNGLRCARYRLLSGSYSFTIGKTDVKAE